MSLVLGTLNNCSRLQQQNASPIISITDLASSSPADFSQPNSLPPGYLWITGRGDDMCNVSGHLISMAQVSRWPRCDQVEVDDIYLESPLMPGGVRADGAQGRGRGSRGARAAPCQGVSQCTNVRCISEPPCTTPLYY